MDDEIVTVEVRPLRESEVLAVVLLREAVAAEGPWIGDADPADRDATVARLTARVADARSEAQVAVLDGQVVGFVSVSDVSGCGDLGMFVDRDHRGQGVGRRLLTAAVAWARERGCHKVVLEVWPHNHSAIRLYESAGFVTEGRRLRHVRRRDGTLWDCIEMGLILDTASPGCPY
jgi:RimJ/RimL family protein N-acetyltransferase